MILIACTDDDGGLAFNRRRLSMDRVVRERILEMSKDSRLWMNHYSYQQYEQYEAGQINVCEEFLNEAVPGDYCLTEDIHVGEFAPWVEKVILFKWNRSYPHDLDLDIDLTDPTWRLVSREDFPGNSHEKLTMEVYER